jgi:hypothetical protein
MLAIWKNESTYGPDIKNTVSREAMPVLDRRMFLTAKPSDNAGKTSEKLYEYIKVADNGEAVGQWAKKVHGGDLHNTCVLFISEALRRIGCSIPKSTSNTDALKSQLTKKGFKKSYNLKELKPGAICFTTDAKGGRGHSTHTYIFLGWEEENIAKVIDNQMYDYESFYHNRDIRLNYLNNDRKKVKEATLYFMYK